ncbi:IgGFc-binding protein [Cereibacter ovatus]|uniref:IgGFc-binding protein n=1 Tax=Cereibacter ovatus TaxID=439529 RepID=UPI00195D2171|nr:IgGFc-binding protein [Cereibacter ovatus]
MTAGAAHASFVANFHANYYDGPNSLFVFGNEGTSGTISGNDGFNQTFTIDATGVFSLALGPGGREMTGSGTVNNLSLLVESADPISGLALNRALATTDMTTLLDLDGLSTKYRVLTIKGLTFDGSQMSVTAVEDNTVVTITPKSILGKTDGVPFEVTLQKGESVYYGSGTNADLSGTLVESSKKVAVFSGAQCTNVPEGIAACDHLIEQQFGTDNFDTEFLIAQTPFAGSDQDLVRVIADQDGTEVFLNGVSQGTINAGEVLTIDNVGNAKLTATKPVSVGQFMRGQNGSRTVGDPAFAMLPSVDQLLDAYAFITPIGVDAFTQNLLNIAIAAVDAASLKLNGVAVDTSGFTLFDGILFGNLAIGVGPGRIEAAKPFLATISGFDDFDSYLTPIASAFSPGVSPPPSVIPLPSSALLLLGGLGAIGALRRRRQKSA